MINVDDLYTNHIGSIQRRSKKHEFQLWNDDNTIRIVSSQHILVL